MSAPVSSRRAILTTGVAVIATAGGVSAAPAPAVALSAAAPDPVFAAIEAAHAAWKAYGKALQVQDGPETDEEAALPQEVADELARQAQQRAWDTEDRTFSMVPTTAAGFVALLEFWWCANVLDYGYYSEDHEEVVHRLENDRENRQIKDLIETGRAFLAGGRT